MRVLVVDDDPLVGEMVAGALEFAGHEVELVEGPQQALDILAADGGFAGVISDMTMPGLSGLELLRELRGRGCGLPFILLSGEDPESLRARGGADVAACLGKDSAMLKALPEIVERLFGPGSAGHE